MPVNVADEIKAVQIIERFDVTPGTIIESNILKADIIVFHRNATLQIGQPDDSFVALWGTRVYIQDGTLETAIFVPRHEVLGGKPGGGGANGADGKPGTNGADGERGADGGTGRDLPDFVFLSDTIEYGNPPADGVPPVSIHAIGVDGGPAGIGGPGGAAGNGTDGGRGESYDDDFLIP